MSDPFIQDADIILCPCGCGERFSAIGSRGRSRSYYSPACSLRVNHNREPSFAGRKHSAEARAKISAAASRPRPWLRGARNGMSGRTGASNPNWKGGGSPERQRFYASGEWRRLRRQLRKRAACMCEVCGATEALHVHHIRSWAECPELRSDLDNLMLLCPDCHRSMHSRGGDAHE